MDTFARGNSPLSRGIPSESQRLKPHGNQSLPIADEMSRKMGITAYLSPNDQPESPETPSGDNFLGPLWITLMPAYLTGKTAYLPGKAAYLTGIAAYLFYHLYISFK
jgi:hypothetical protein